MPTIEEEKPAKPRQRSRTAADQRSPKGERKVEMKAEVRPDPDPVSPIVAPIEAATIEAAPLTITVEAATEPALSGEVLPPETRNPVTPAAGLPAIAQAYDDYARKSWTTGRFFAERLITVRSIDGVIEIQGEFAKQAYANFLTHSQKICELYGEWAQQLFAPIEKFTTPWTRIGR